MKTLLLPLLIVLVSLSTPAGATQPPADMPQRIPTITRLVQLFSTLENELMTAVEKGDPTTIDKMLAGNFELRSGDMPGIPTPRAEWLRYSRGQLVGSIEQMAVHDYGTVEVVSYLWKREAGHDIFIVDVWVKSGDAWKLSVRYASPAGDYRFTIPGAAIEISPIKKR